MGLPLVCDATLVSPVKANGIPRPRAAHEPRIAIANIEDVKATTYPELVSSMQCKFLIFAGEVGGRWSATTCRLLRDLAAAKSQNASPPLRKSAAFAWENRWWSMRSVATDPERRTRRNPGRRRRPAQYAARLGRYCAASRDPSAWRGA